MLLRPLVPFLMSEDEIRTLHHRALRILDEIGLQVSDPRLVDRLRGRRGVRFVQGRVTLDPDTVAEMVGLDERQQVQVPEHPHVPEQISIVTSYHARHIVDVDTGIHRPLTEQDAIEMAKLSDALRDRGVLGGAPGAPQDLPARLRSVAQYKISVEWSRAGHYAPVSSVAEYRFIRDMARAIGKDFGMECYLISPLRLEGDEVTAVLDYLETCAPGDRPVPVSVTSMPTMGLSGPVDPLALFVLGIAESIGGFVSLSLAFGEEVQAQMSRPNAYPCDFRTGRLIVGSPEALLIEVIRRDLDRFYRHPSWARAVRTMSALPGVQSAAEKAAGAVVAALGGYSSWFGGGLIGLDEVFSPLQLMIDLEIRDYALQVVQGFEADLDFDDVTVLREIIDSREERLPFMTHPTTVEGFRRVFRQPRLFQRDAYKGEPNPGDDVLETARKEVKELVAGHTYRLETPQLEEVERIYALARTELG